MPAQREGPGAIRQLKGNKQQQVRGPKLPHPQTGHVHQSLHVLHRGQACASDTILNCTFSPVRSEHPGPCLLLQPPSPQLTSPKLTSGESRQAQRARRQPLHFYPNHHSLLSRAEKLSLGQRGHQYPGINCTPLTIQRPDTGTSFENHLPALNAEQERAGRNQGIKLWCQKKATQ